METVAKTSIVLVTAVVLACSSGCGLFRTTPTQSEVESLVDARDEAVHVAAQLRVVENRIQTLSNMDLRKRRQGQADVIKLSYATLRNQVASSQGSIVTWLRSEDYVSIRSDWNKLIDKIEHEAGVMQTATMDLDMALQADADGAMSGFLEIAMLLLKIGNDVGTAIGELRERDWDDRRACRHELALWLEQNLSMPEYQDVPRIAPGSQPSSVGRVAIPNCTDDS